MADLSFTHIYETARARMGITRDEYALCNYIQTWASYPGNARAGWCDRTAQQKAEWVGVTVRGLQKMQTRMIQIGLIERDKLVSGHFRITKAWFEIISALKSENVANKAPVWDEQSSVVGVNKVQVGGEQSSGEGVNKVHVRGEQSSVVGVNKVHTHNKVYKEEEEEKVKRYNVAELSNVSFFETNTEIVEIEPIQETTPVPRGNTDFVVINGEAVPVSPVEVVIDFLNKNLTPARLFSKTTKKTVESINAKLREKYTVEDICLVIEHKITQWKGDPKMEQYLRPETLFGTGKFESYLVAATTWAANGKKNGHGTANGNRAGSSIVDKSSTVGAFADR